MWVKVIYEGEWFLGKVLGKVEGKVQVRCLDKPFGIKEPQTFEREADAILYEMVYKADVEPKNVKVGRKYLLQY